MSWSKNTIRLASTLDKSYFEAVYATKSLVDVCKYFSITKCDVESLLKYWGIKHKTAEEAARTKRESTIRRCKKLYETTNGGCSAQALAKIKQAV